MSRLTLKSEEILNAVQAARDVASSAARDAIDQPDPAERQRLLSLQERYEAIALRLERTLLDRRRAKSSARGKRTPASLHSRAQKKDPGVPGS
jgi:hypothetical protein